uniref:metalloprotease n=1 Tax=Arhodomonas sp. AD133 TaxID=3415009 RepID=UPI003EC12B93
RPSRHGNGIGPSYFENWYTITRVSTSIAFPITRARVLGQDVQSPAGFRGMFEDAKAELEALGFEEPVWVLNTFEPRERNPSQLQAAFCHRASGVIAWVLPPVDPGRAGRPLVYFTTRLEDGRYVVTQVEDPFFQVIDDLATPARTVAADEFRGLVELHAAFVAEQGVEVDRCSGDVACVREFAGAWQRRLRERLIERGRLQVSDGIARPSLGFGLRILVALHRRPVAPQKSTSKPAALLALLWPQFERQKSLSPSRRHETILFLVSALLSLAIGTPVLGFELTAILLGVIGFHELGHWVAMRAFGYRSAHITFLPLLGGVTIGHENSPDPAKRAWVSLAGPLPGIVLGWALAAWLFMGAGLQSAPGWMTSLAWALLFVNYLNVLPIPPLDGSHVVRALLPARWVKLQILFLVLGVALAVAVGVALEFWILPALALFQLLLIPRMIRMNRAVAAVEVPQDSRSAESGMAIRGILDHMEALFGEADDARGRLTDAREVLALVTMRRLPRWHGALIGGVFAILVAVPVAGLAVATGFMPLFATLPEASPDTAVQARVQHERQELEAAAEAMSLSELVDAVSGDAATPRPATPEAIRAAESRLGVLPASLARLYDAANGLPQLALGRLSAVGPVKEDDAALELLGYGVYDGKQLLFLADADRDYLELPVEHTAEWWVLGNSSYGDQRLFWAPNGMPGYPEYHFIDFHMESPTVYRDAGHWLRARWVADRLSEVRQAAIAERRADFRAKLADADVGALVERFPRPTVFARLIGWVPDWPSGASVDAVRALERRVGVSMDPAHADLLRLHDGFPPLSVLSAADVVPFEVSSDAVTPATFERAYTGSDGTDVRLTREGVSDCWVVSGLPMQENGSIMPQLLWCPDADVRDRAFVDLASATVHRSFREYLVHAVVQRTVY